MNSRMPLLLLLITTMITGQFAQERVVKYNIQEGADVGTVIGDVALDSGMLEEFPPGSQENLKFILIDRTGAFLKSHPFLKIDENTGMLSTSDEIDRESVCPYMEVCEIDIDVAFSSTNNFQVIDVSLTILDINDHAPDFGQATAFIEIPESALVGSGYPLPLATDPDGIEFGIVGYRLQSQFSVPFEIQVIPNMQDPLSLDLAVTEPLDRERISSYAFAVIATDGGYPPKEATLRVNVTVTDINDNHPEFEHPEYHAQIQENSDVPYTVVTVIATDDDIGQNGRITYELSSSTKNKYGHMFDVNEDSGIVTLLQPLDREDEDEFVLTVTARDRGARSRLASTNVVVTVTDVNDNNPIVNVNSMAADGQPVISEGSKSGTFVALVTAFDSDLGMNAEITCLLYSSKFTIQPLQKSKYKIVTASTFDRESQDVHNISLSCHDDGYPILTTETVVSVRVDDVNDNAPVFPESVYTAAIEENAAVGSIVTTITATDKDDGENARLTYTLFGPMAQYFTIDSDTGDVKVSNGLDHENFSEMSINVVATDNGDPSFSSNTEVQIRIIDVNDEAPKFVQDSYTFVVVENQARDFELGYVEAYDRDDTPFNIVTFNMADAADTNTSSAINVFSLNPETGVLTTRVSLDRETTPVYFINILAGNPGYPGLTSSVSATIFVADDNDNAPVLDFPNKDNFTVTISSYTNQGNTVTQLRSHDMDTGNNAAVSYELRAYDEVFWDCFIVDSLSGLVYVNKDLSSFTDVTTVRLKVIATDHGAVTLDAQQDIIIIIDPSIPVIPDISDYHNIIDTYEPKENDNMLVIIVVVALSGVLIIMLLGAIVFVLLRSRRNSRHRDMMDGKPGGSELRTRSPVPNNNMYEEVGYVGGDEDRIIYKDMQNQDEKSRDPPSTEKWGGNVLKNNYRDSPPPCPKMMTSRVPSHEIGMSYVPPDAPPYGSNKRKRSNDKRMADIRRMQLATPGIDDPVLDLDTSSSSSGDMSNADSGRGASEEGETAPPLPRQDYRPTMTLKKNQGSSYPKLTSFQSPAQSPRTNDPPSYVDDDNKDGGRPTPAPRSNVLTKHEDISAKPHYNFANSDSLLRYKNGGAIPGKIRRSSGTPSEMTDLSASTTSGSYMIHTDVDDLGSQRNIRECDV